MNLPFKVSLITAAVVVMTACSDDDNPAPAPINFNDIAVVKTVAPDFSSSDVEVIGIDEDYDVSGSLIPSQASDYIVEANDGDIYHIGRFGLDTVTKYVLEDGEVVQDYDFSVKETPESVSPNIHKMVFASEDKAYLINYGDAAITIVDPTATSESDFRTGEIDLSAYGDQDGLTEAHDAVIIDGQMFVALQRLNRNNGWSPVDNQPYIVVIDIATDEEVDTNPNDDAANLKGIELAINNPQRLVYNAAAGLMVVGSGDPFYNFSGRDPGYSGGIVSIDTNDFSTSMVVDDGPAEGENPYGFIMDLAVLDANNGFFVGSSQGFGATFTLFHFNPATGAVSDLSNGELSDVSVSELVAGPDGNVWVGIGDAAAPRIALVDTDLDIIRELPVTLNPDVITFTQVEAE